MTKPHIDLEKMQIVGESGTIYKIIPEMLSAGRLPEYEIRGMTLGFRTDFDTVLRTINEVEEVLMRGKDNAQGNAVTAVNKLRGIKNGMIQYATNGRAAVIEFCSLVCIKEGENIGVHTEEQIRDKFNDWASIPAADFFYLAARLTPSFPEHYNAALRQNQAN